MAAPTRQIEAFWVEEQTLEIIRDLLAELGAKHAAGKVSPTASFERDLGLGSLERVELLVRCEARFDVQLPDEIAQEAETPAEWVRAILSGNVVPPVQPRYGRALPGREAPAAPDSATTLVEVLHRHAETEPDRVHILLPEDGIGPDSTGREITYRELLEVGKQIAAGLVAGGLRRNETVAIMLPTGSEFFFAFYGVVLAGGIPVPIYPPTRPDKIEEYIRRQIQILRNAEVRFLISFDRVRTVSHLMRVNLPSLIDFTTVQALRDAGKNAPKPAVAPSDIALIQYTSGSTGDPKGVTLTQSNILSNIRGIGWAVKVRPTDVVVSWLPLYHDMGLIGAWLFSLYYATPITVLSPMAFLGKPERWLWAMHHSRGTLCPAPNFAYELCARKIPDRALEGLDLSHWRVAINAGEAVLPETLSRFSERFGAYGFRAESFLPCYGLAESSVALTFPPLDRVPVVDTIQREAFEMRGEAVPALPGDPGTIRFVAVGGAMPGHEVRVIEEIDQGMPRDAGERRQGRILFRGPSRTDGYYRNPEATAAVVTDEGWMDSGDLGYWTGGELYITGRRKDCIIKSGRNIIPQEVEAAASEAPGVRQGCVAAFGLLDADSGTERLVVVAETRATRKDERRRIKTDIVRAVGTVLGIPPDRVQLAPPRSIPKTSSGKIRRNETRALYLGGKLEAATRPPWLQIARLSLESAGAWLRLTWQRAAERLRGAYVATLLAIACGFGGTLARLVKRLRTPRSAARVVQFAARAFTRLSGCGTALHGAEQIAADRPAVLVANRPGSLDPLLLSAGLPTPFLLADAGVLAALPRPAAYLLESVVVGAVAGETAPRGGTLRQRIRRALEEGNSVLVFPEGPVGQAASLCRFRLDAFHAAVETTSVVHPVAIEGTSDVYPSRPRFRSDDRDERRPRITVGTADQAELVIHREMVRLRNHVREVLSEICEQT